MWALITGCTSQPSAIEPAPVSVYAIEQNAQGYFVVCTRPCFKTDVLTETPASKPVDSGLTANDINTSADLDLDFAMPEKNKPSSPVLHLVQFEFSEHRISPREAESLARMAEEMKDLPHSTGFWLRGYTDDIGPKIYNQRLAEKRVEAVAEKFTELGLSVLRKEALGACCFVASNDTPDGRALNRRVEVFVLNEKRAGVDE